jgi:hypothetical protein
MDRLAGMFDLGGRRVLGGGCESPPAACQGRRANDELSEDGYTIVSGQARSDGGPPTQNDEFNLRGQADRSPMAALQRDANEATFWTKEGENKPAGGPPAPPPPLLGGPMPPQGQGVAMRANTTQDPPYSGFDEAMKKWGMGTEASILRDLTWQREVDGDTNKITHKSA